MTVRTRLAGIANPIPWASGRMAVLMPTTAPQRSTSGPPEFPWLIAASVWIIGSRRDQEEPGRIRLTAETMPRVSVCSRPKGFPMAKTSSPTRIRSSVSSRATGSVPSSGSGIRRIARSKSGSAPTIRAGTFVPRPSVTTTALAPKITWAFVRTRPEASMITPDPAFRESRSTGSRGSIDIVETETTARETWS